MNRPSAFVGPSRRFLGIGIVGVVIGLLLLSVVFGSWYTIDQGERGVRLRYGAIVGVAEPGLNFKIPFVDTVEPVSVQNLTIVYDRVESYSMDQQTATLRLSVSYRVPMDSVEDLYSQYGTID
jgi:regulator of protease activity HflC (stomatin/prohibitin superfamily)